MTGRIVYHDLSWEHDPASLREPELTAIERTLGMSAGAGGSS